MLRRPATVESELNALRRALAKSDPVVCGPFLGEPGYETLYWVPFVRRLVLPLLREGRAVVLFSRGGAEPLYRDLIALGARYVDVLDLMSADEFVGGERERMAQDKHARNQKRSGATETALLERAGLAGARPLLPEVMHPLLRRWRYSDVCEWDEDPDFDAEREDLTLLKFWFGGQLPPTQENLDHVARWIERFAEQGPVAAIENPHTLEVNVGTDDAFADLVERLGLPTRATTSARTNIADQIEMIAGARRLVSTYGGLAYLSLYTGTPLVSFYSNPKITFSRHFANFATAAAARNSKRATHDLPITLIDLNSV